MAQVNMPRPRRRDSLDTILKGLQIAGQIYGIKDASRKSELLAQQTRTAELQAEETERQLSGELTPAMKTKAEMGGVEFVPPTTPGAQRFGIGEDKEPLFAITPEFKGNLQKQAQLDRAFEQNAAKIAQEQNKSKIKIEGDLRKEYRKASDDNLKTIQNFRKVEAAATNPNPTGATDVNLVFSFMKTLDPGSVVREGEFATAEQTAGIPGKVVNLYNKLLSGQRLTPQQRQGFLQEAAAIADSQIQMQEATDTQFSRLAKEAGVDVEDVIDERFADFRVKLEDLKKQFQPVVEQPRSLLLPQAFGAPPANRDRRVEDVVNSFLGE